MEKIICVVEAVIILILLVLIIFRKIGRPLSEAEAQERIKQKREKMEDARLRAKEERERLEEQENMIKEMKTPITLIAARGSLMEGFVVCVKDAGGKIESFSGKPNLQFPRFLALYTRVLQYRKLGGRTGGVLIE